MLVQPDHDLVVGVSAVVVEDHVDLESLGDLMVNGAQELQELAVAVPGKTLADHHSGHSETLAPLSRLSLARLALGLHPAPDGTDGLGQQHSGLDRRSGGEKAQRPG